MNQNINISIYKSDEEKSKYINSLQRVPEAGKEHE